MKQRRKSKNVRILSATVVVIFTLLASFSGTFAWFQAQRTISTSTNAFEVVNQGESVAGLSFHAYTGTVTSNTVEYYTFDPQPAGQFEYQDGELKPVDEENPFVLTMNDYTLESPHQPILILIALSNSGSSYVSFNNSSVYPTTNNSLKGADQGDNPLSSIVEFYTFTYSSDENDTTHILNRVVNDHFALPTSEFIKESDEEHGIESNWNSFAKFKTNGDYNGFGSEAVLYNGSTAGLSYIGIVVDYYSDSLEWISSFYLGDERLEEKLTFACDWWMNLC